MRPIRQTGAIRGLHDKISIILAGPDLPKDPSAILKTGTECGDYFNGGSLPPKPAGRLMDVLRDGSGRACVPVKRAGVYSLVRFRRRGGCECISYCRWRPGPPSVWGHAAASVRDRIEEKSAYLISFYFCSQASPAFFSSQLLRCRLRRRHSGRG